MVDQIDRSPPPSSCRLSMIHDAENVSVGIFEPRPRDMAGDVYVTLASRIGQVVVFEPDPLRLERADRILDIVNRPGQSRAFVGAGEAGTVDVDGRVSALEDDDLVTFAA